MTNFNLGRICMHTGSRTIFKKFTIYILTIRKILSNFFRICRIFREIMCELVRD